MVSNARYAGIANIGAYPALSKRSTRIMYHLLTAFPQGFWILGAVFFCTTGGSLSDLGHCGRPNIQVRQGICQNGTILNYMGQGAWLLSGRHEDAWQY